MTYVSSTHPLRMSAAEMGARMEIRRLETLVADMQDDPGVSAGTDLDETRRLLYIALAASKTQRHATLVGTLVNALAHHSGIESDADEAMKQLLRLVRGYGSAEENTEAQDWLRRTIETITQRLAAGS